MTDDATRLPRRRWVILYSLAVLGSTPLALPCWNAFLSARIGHFLTIEQIHLLEYGGLGAVAALAGSSLTRSWMKWVIVMGVGLADELLQLVLPQRVFQWSDVFLNWGGGVAGFLLIQGMFRLVNRVRPVDPSSVSG